MKKLVIVQFVIAAFLYVLGTILANLSLIPYSLMSLFWFDEVGHFLVFGLLAYSVGQLLSLRTKRWVLGYVSVAVFMLIDESLQLLSQERTFSLLDIFMSTLGITFFYVFHVWLLKIVKNKKVRIFYEEMTVFTLQQAKASVFGILLLSAMLITNYISLPFLYRYDYLFIVAILIQVALITMKIETKKEVLVIFVFHVVATIMELFKTSDSIGSWNYPENAVIMILGVPLFAGFMYSAVGSYIARIWKLFSFRFTQYPEMGYTYVVAFLIYLNFFTHHFFYDIRYILFICVLGLYWRTRIFFKLNREWNMPLLVGFFLVSLFIWIAENIATYVNVWYYPNQKIIWELVSFQKIGSWFLLMIISFILVSILYRDKINKKD